MTVVVVESPAKARTINRYLGKEFTVLPSFGHVRDLARKDGSVNPDDGFRMVWEVADKAQAHVRAIADALKKDDRLVLATDPDREGEAISWHLVEALRKRRAIGKSTEIERVVFNAVTETAVAEAMRNPRDIDMELVEAYLARRALDYLVGYRLSPVLWRKLPGAKSAGRVQSVALRMIVEREMEIEAFRPREYWSVKARLKTPRGDAFEARLTTLDGKTLGKYDLADAAAARKATAAVEAVAPTVASIEAKPVKRAPAPPFMTSTLQQEASRKLNMGAQACMRAAQKLYEAGHITYMRTDAIHMAKEAVAMARDAIGERYGEAYVPKSPRYYKNKAKNAQEAHECIRPSRMHVAPAELKTDFLLRELYNLIWKRAIASQMEDARFERTTVEIGDGRTGLRATGQVTVFDGFLKAYEEGRDDAPEEKTPKRGEPDGGGPENGAPEDDRRLPEIRESDALERLSVASEQHFTQPPPRFTEATLVKRMEELGIGRPSTYAPIINTIQTREYVRKDKNRLIPESKGRLVTIFLSNWFRRYVEYDFTASLEEELDDISGGRMDWQGVLNRFWTDFSGALEQTADLRTGEVLEKINEILAPHLFPDAGDGRDPALCPRCGEGRLFVRTARTGGAFIGCRNYPDCRYIRSLDGIGDESEDNDRLLGRDPEGAEVRLKIGRFGPYVQLGEAEGDDKPKRCSLPKTLAPADATLETALNLLALPREIGPHPDDGGTVWAGIGRYGPYVKHDALYAGLEKGDDIFTVGMNRAVDLLARKRAGRRGAAQKALRELGEHPDGGAIAVMDGRYGPYVKWGKINASLPKDGDPAAISIEEALDLLAAKAKAKKTKRGGKPKKKSAGTP